MSNDVTNVPLTNNQIMAAVVKAAASIGVPLGSIQVMHNKLSNQDLVQWTFQYEGENATIQHPLYLIPSDADHWYELAREGMQRMIDQRAHFSITSKL